MGLDVLIVELKLLLQFIMNMNDSCIICGVREVKGTLK